MAMRSACYCVCHICENASVLFPKCSVRPHEISQSPVTPCQLNLHGGDPPHGPFPPSYCIVHWTAWTRWSFFQHMQGQKQRRGVLWPALCRLQHVHAHSPPGSAPRLVPLLLPSWAGGAGWLLCGCLRAFHRKGNLFGRGQCLGWTVEQCRLPGGQPPSTGGA